MLFINTLSKAAETRITNLEILNIVLKLGEMAAKKPSGELFLFVMAIILLTKKSKS